MTPNFEELLRDCVLNADVTFGRPRSDGALKKITANELNEFIRHCAQNPNLAMGGLHFPFYEIEGTLNLANMSFGFPIYFDHCTFKGFLEFSGLTCRSMGFIGSELQKGIDLRDAEIKGYLLMKDGFRCLGPLLLRDAHISKSLEFQNSSLLFDGNPTFHKARDAEGECCSLSRVRCDALYWYSLHQAPRGNVNFRDLVTKTFKNDLQNDKELKNWPNVGKLILDGFEYTRFSQCPPARALKWISLQKPVTTSSLSNLAKAYSNENLKQNSTEIISEIKKIEIQQIENPFIRIINWMIFWSIGFGARLQRPIFIFFLLFLAHLTLSIYLEKLDFTKPIINEFLTEDCINGPSSDCGTEKIANWRELNYDTPPQIIYIPKKYPEFIPILYTIEKFFPFFDFHQGKYWEFSRWSINFMMGLISACALFVSGVFVGGLSGILIPKLD